MSGRLPICERWFSSVSEGDLTCLTEPHTDVLIRSNTWLLKGAKADLLVDAGNGLTSLRPIVDSFREERDKPLIAVATHGHMDHVGGLSEFDERIAHPLDAGDVASPHPLLLRRDVWDAVAEQMAGAGSPVPEVLIDSQPTPDFDPETFRPAGGVPTRLVEEGDLIDLGDKAFQVLHLPGHTPGSIGLWDEEHGVLFSGDAVYGEEPLIDTAPTSDIEAYLSTMERLRELPVDIVHGGHDASFDRRRLIEMCDAYIARRS